MKSYNTNTNNTSNNNNFYLNNLTRISQTKKQNKTETNNLFKNSILTQNLINDFKYQYNPFIKKLKLIKRNISENNKKNYGKNKLRKKFRDTYQFQKESLLTNTSTNYIDAIKSQLIKKNSQNKSYDTYLNSSSVREKKIENKKKLLFEKLKSKEIRLKQIKNINKIIQLNQNKDSIDKNEYKLIKVKMHKILKENDNKICNKFERKNNSFNEKLKHYFKSEKYLLRKKIQDNNFSTTKKDFYSSHNLSDFYFDFDKDLYNDEEFITKAVINSFSDREKKIISSSPKYFSIHKKKYLLKKLKINPNETLKEKLQKEENMEKLKNKDEIMFDRKSTKNIKNIFKKKLNANKNKYFNDNIKDKIIKKSNSLLNKRDTKRNLYDYFDKEIKNYYSKYYLFCYNNKKNTNFKGNEDYYKMFNYPINYNMTKEFILDKNNERLNKEEHFHYLREKNNMNNDYINNTISKFQAIMRDNYKE